MKDKVFADTNILIYYISDNTEKKDISKELLTADFFGHDAEWMAGT